MKPAKAGQPYSAAINHVIVGQVLHSPALNEGHVLVNPPYLELLLPRIVYLFASPPVAVPAATCEYSVQVWGIFGESQRQSQRSETTLRMQNLNMSRLHTWRTMLYYKAMGG